MRNNNYDIFNHRRFSLFIWLATWTVFCLMPYRAIAQSQEGTATVKILIFSGRPNPTVSLNATETKALRNKLTKIMATAPATNALPPPKLGFNGFLISGHGIAELPSRVWLYEGRLHCSDKEQTLTRDATDLDGWLCAVIGSKDLSAEVKTELEKYRQSRTRNPSTPSSSK